MLFAYLFCPWPSDFPYYIHVINIFYVRFLRKFIERNSIQIKDCKTFWKKNGAIYIINPVSIRDKPIEKFEKVIKYEMDYLSSIDIDTNSDWENAQSHLKNLIPKC